MASDRSTSSEWQPDQYLKFEKERTQPTIDLAARIEVESPGRIIDIGCGTGNSTTVLRQKWPGAACVGLDSSRSMLDKAHKLAPDIEWVQRDASDSLSDLGSFDIVFSNAALQWLPDHHLLIPKMFALLNKKGALAVQAPYALPMPTYQEAEKLAVSPKWKAYHVKRTFQFNYRDFDYFYDLLCGLTKELYLWKTNYIHVLKSPEDVVEWTKGTMLRPYLDVLPDEALKKEFTAEYTEGIRRAYPVQRDGSVLLPFTRIFFLAYNMG